MIAYICLENGNSGALLKRAQRLDEKELLKLINLETL